MVVQPLRATLLLCLILLARAAARVSISEVAHSQTTSLVGRTGSSKRVRKTSSFTVSNGHIIRRPVVQEQPNRQLVAKKLLEDGVHGGQLDKEISAWKKLPLAASATVPCFVVGPQCYPKCVHGNKDRKIRTSVCLEQAPLTLTNQSCYEIQDQIGHIHNAKFYLPSVIGIGPAKSGTTTLFGMLFTHPSVLPLRTPK